MADMKIFKNMLDRFERYAIQKSWMGGAHPNTWENTKLGYDLSKADLIGYFKSCLNDLKKENNQ